MHRLIATLALALLLAGPAVAAEPAKRAVLYKNPQCGCCESYADYLRENGFDVQVVATHDLAQIKRQYSVPEPLEGCHTMLIDDYVIEGHVPLRTLERLLTLRPEIDGISLPGMPAGSPGMTGDKSGPFVIHQFDDGTSKPFFYE